MREIQTLNQSRAVSREASRCWIMRNSSLLVLLSALMHVTSSRLHEFVSVPVAMNWPDAQVYCRQRYTDLPTIDDQSDHNALLKTAGMGDVWLGLSRTTEYEDFAWSDQSNSSFSFWKSGQPNGQLCVNMEKGYWYDRDCVDDVHFACYIDRKKLILRLEMKSSHNLNDPGVMNMILAKIEQVLKEKGLTQYAKLSWRVQSDDKVFQKEE